MERSTGIIPTTENYDFPSIPETTKLTGVSFENRQDIIPDLFEGQDVYLERDNFNKQDKYAIKVLTKCRGNIVQIGWIPKELAKILAPELDVKMDWHGTIEKITGGKDQTKGVVIKLIYGR